jgi:hypothetical protein
MTQNQLMTAGALAFAGFALWYVLNGSSTNAPTAASPGQQRRDLGLAEWMKVLAQQEEDITHRAPAQYTDELNNILGPWAVP